MTRVLVGLIAIALLGAAAVFVWTTLEESDIEALEPEVGSDVAQDDDPSRSARRATSYGPGEAAEVGSEVVDAEGFESDPATAVQGRVVNRAGVPVTAAEVSLRVNVKSGPEAATAATIEGSRTDSEGRFRLEGVPHGVPLRLRARHPDLQDATATVLLRPGEDRDLGDLVAEPGGSVSGKVVAADGIPVAGASLRVYPAEDEDDASPFAILRVITGSLESGRSDETDAEGLFRITGVAPGKVRVVVKATGHPPAVHDPVEVYPGRETPDVIVRLKPGHDLEVLVRGPEGAPLRGAGVRLRSAGFDVEDLLSQIHGGQRGETDGEGRFVLHGLGKRAYKLEVVQPGYFERNVDIADDQKHVDVQLERAGVVWGVVTVKHDGTPVEKFLVEAKGGEHLEVLYGADAALAAATDEVPGLYAIAGNTDDHLSFLVSADGYAHARRSLKDLGGDHVREDVSLVLQVPFAGRVVDTDGEPVAGVKVRVTAAAQDDEAAGPAAAIERVRDRARARRAPRARRGGFSDENGEFRVEGLEPGDVTVNATHPRYLDAEPRAMTLVAEEPVEGHEIVLSRGATLKGIVRDVGGAPLARAVVSLSKEKQDGEEAPRRMHVFRGSTLGGGFKDAVSDENGRYEIHAIPPGAYRVKVEEPEEKGTGADAASFLRIVGLSSGATESGEPVTASGEEVITLDLAIKQKARIVGTVTAAGAAVKGVTVEARSAEQAIAFGKQPRAETDSAGAFVIANVKPGKYRVTATPPGSPSPMTLEVDVQPGADAVAEFTLAGGAIRGRVIDASGDGVAGAEVWARASGTSNVAGDMEDAMRAVRVALDTGSGMRAIGGGGPLRVVTDAAGDYELPFVRPGNYAVSCKHADFMKPDVVRAVVSDGDATEGVDFSLVLGGTIEVTVENPTGSAGPFAFNRFSIKRTGHEGKPTNKTSIDATARFEGLEPGTYEVTVRSGNSKGEGTAVVQAGYVESLVLRVR